MDDRTPS
jgi:hypothetical protein